MLVLSRKPLEEITFPGLDIRITVLRIGTNRVQLGIQAPRHIDVSRPEATSPFWIDKQPSEPETARQESSAEVVTLSAV